MTDYLTKTMPLHGNVRKEWAENLNKVVVESSKEYKTLKAWCEKYGCELIKEEQGLPDEEGKEKIVISYRAQLKEGEIEYPKKHSQEYAEWANWCNQNGCVIVKDNDMYVCQKVDEHRYIKQNEDGSVYVLGYKANPDYVLDDDTEVVEGWDGKTYIKGQEPAQEGEKWAEKRIQELQALLTDEDYKIIKCAECSVAGESSPYDIEELHSKRQSYRNEINTLQSKYNL